MESFLPLFWILELRHFLAPNLQVWNTVPIFYFWCLVFIFGGCWPLLTDCKAWKWRHPWYVVLGTLGSRLDVSCSSAGRVSLLTPVSKTIDADVALAMPDPRFFWLWNLKGPSAAPFALGLHCWSLVSGKFWQEMMLMRMSPKSVHVHDCVCVCVFVCVRERERERGRKKQGMAPVSHLYIL